MSDVTRILSQIDAGDPRAAEQLLPLVYDELRKLAAARLANEKPGQTLQATALVHEAYLRLVGSACRSEPDSPDNVEGRSRPVGLRPPLLRRGSNHDDLDGVRRLGPRRLAKPRAPRGHLLPRPFLHHCLSIRFTSSRPADLENVCKHHPIHVAE